MTKQRPGISNCHAYLSVSGLQALEDRRLASTYKDEIWSLTASPPQTSPKYAGPSINFIDIDDILQPYLPGAGELPGGCQSLIPHIWRALDPAVFGLALSHLRAITTARPQLRPRQQSFASGINGTTVNSDPVALNVSINGGGRNATSPFLYGWMFEDINHSGDGGIYAEMVANRAFQGAIPGLDSTNGSDPIVPYGPVLSGWQPIGAAEISLNLEYPLSTALPTVLQLTIPWDATGEVGILNEGWWGMDVRPQTYNASFYILGSTETHNGSLSHIDVSIRSDLTDDIWCSESIPFSPGNNISTFAYQQYAVQLINTATAPNSNNTFAITFDASEVAGNTYYISLVSLFPETYRNRPNGLRRDLGQLIEDMGTKFLRFPGGNNIEGQSVFTRWKWQNTIGPLIDRPGRIGDWGYYNTDGLGLLEFLEWTEDMNIERVLAIYAGYSLDGTSYPESSMGSILEDALNELEYCMGDTSTTYGALRAQHGHPEPFEINYIELGNEDWFSSTYPYRFPILYNGIKKAYPNITLISTAYNENIDYTIDVPAGGMWDTHHYEEPTFFLEQFNKWDNWQAETNNTDVDVFIGEYSVFQIDTPSGVVNYSDPLSEHISYPRVLSAIAESIYLIGAERSPNTVKLSSYAPSFQNFNWYNWTPNLVAFTANYDETVASVSYYSQKLLASFRGTQTLPVTATTGEINPLWWVATIDENSVYVKIINSGATTISLTLTFDVSFSSVNGSMLSSNELNAFNFRNNQTAVVVVDAGIPSQSGTQFQWSVPMFSITVLQFDISAAASNASTISSTFYASSAAPTASSATQVGMTSNGQSQVPSLTTVPGGPTLTQPQVPASTSV